MTSEPASLITDAAVRAGGQAEGVHALLTPGEQARLHTVLWRAAGNAETDGEDVLGLVWAVGFNSFSYLDVVASGLQRDNAAKTHDGGQ